MVVSLQVTDNIVTNYSKQAESEITELNKTIVALRTKVVMLTDTIVSEREASESIPLPKSIISQVIDLERELAHKQKIIEYYENCIKEVDETIIINKDKIIPPRRRSAFKK